MADNTIYLLDALFLLVAGMAAIFAFGLSTSRFAGTFKLIFFLFLGLFLFTLVLGYLPQAKHFSDLEQGENGGAGIRR